MRVLEIILLNIDFGETIPQFASAPALPPKGYKYSTLKGGENPLVSPSPNYPHNPMSSQMTVTTSSVTPHVMSDAPQSLKNAPWYWGAITREQVSISRK